MTTTAGSLALEGSIVREDATVAVIVGKTNLLEWANFRSTQSSSGLSSGSASANLAAASLGTETNGFILSPAAACWVVGLKPTVGLMSRAGVVPIAESQDTVGPVTRTVEDAAIILSALVGVDFRDPATEES